MEINEDPFININLEDHVCSLEFAKELEKLGVKQKSLFYYVGCENPLTGIFKESDLAEERWGILYHQDEGFKHASYDWYYSAFTAGELGMMLDCEKWEETFYNGFRIVYFDHRYKKQLNKIIVNFEKEADARAKLLIFLITEGIL